MTNTLEESKQAKQLVEECADDLSSINSEIKEELENLEPLPGIEAALALNVDVEQKVQKVSKKLSNLNRGLNSQVRGTNLLVHQFAAAVEQEEAARHAALHDVLTDLPNRALFDDRLEHELAHARRQQRGIAVMFIDLDDFKRINDTHGHDVGDRVLQIVAQRLKKNTRSDDTISRYGGDEFLYLLSEIRDAAHVESIARKLARTVQAPCRVNVRGADLRLGVKASIGIAIFPENGGTAKLLMKHADTAMYRAKQDGTEYAFAE